MPEAFVKYPDGMFTSTEDAAAWPIAVQDVVAVAMSGVNEQGDVVRFNPRTDVDVPSISYNPRTSLTTAVVMITIVTYRWGSRMEDMEARLLQIGEALRPLVPAHLIGDGQKAVNVTFLSKEPGCWVEV